MRAAIAGPALGAALALSACQWCAEGAAPHGVSDQPIGARCVGGWECAGGLDCLGARCAVACASTGTCPAGSFCVEGARDPSGTPLRLCLPGCATDADCLLGATVGVCLLGADPAFCDVAVCHEDADCPDGARCVGAEEARGITWNEYCTDGYCQS